MAISDAFMGSCRTAIGALSELTAFRAALAVTEHTPAGRRAAQLRAFGGTASPAYALSRAITEAVNALADASGALGRLDRLAAVSTLAAEYLPTVVRPPSDAAEAAETALLLAEG
jgi:hypothetical protein